MRADRQFLLDSHRPEAVAPLATPVKLITQPRALADVIDAAAP